MDPETIKARIAEVERQRQGKLLPDEAYYTVVSEKLAEATKLGGWKATLFLVFGECDPLEVVHTYERSEDGVLRRLARICRCSIEE